MRKISLLVLISIVISALASFSMGNAQGLGLDIAVTPEGYDHMQSLLDEWNYQYTVIPKVDLADSGVTNQYDVIFINCAGGLSGDNAANNLKNFVNNGGAIYASDWAYVFIEAAFPTYVDFGYKDGPVQTADATIKDVGLIDYLAGEETLSFYYDLGGWIPIESVSSDVEVLAEADVEYGGSSYPHMPAVVRFSHGSGSVVYTTFHEAAQGGKVKMMMQYLMLNPLTSGAAHQIRQNLESGGYEIEKDNRGEINQGETVDYTIVLNTSMDLIFEMNWGGSELQLSVYRPDGSLYGQQSSSNPPVSVVVNGAEKGTWKYKVTGVNVPSEHYPYALMVGSKDSSGTGDGIPVWVLALIGVVIAVVIVVAVMLVVIKRKKPPAAPQYPPQQYYQQPYQPQGQPPPTPDPSQGPPPSHPGGPPPDSPPPPPPPPP